MKVASNACGYSKFSRKGLFLTEHRRCYDELIAYCNELVYDGKLQPLRGALIDDKKYPFSGEQAFAHIHIPTLKSEKCWASRYNPAEQKAITDWLLKYYDVIKNAYPTVSSHELIGIVTPFKAQADELKKRLEILSKEISQNVAVGTVHTFQGGERRIILFSTVYGSEDGCAFLDYQKNLLNVAVSRAKDRFIIFGDINCLSSSKSKPSGLLKQFLNEKPAVELR